MSKSKQQSIMRAVRRNQAVLFVNPFTHMRELYYKRGTTAKQ
jgi:hypothetical protein